MKVRQRSVSEKCVSVLALLSLVLPCSASRVRRVFRKRNTIPRGSRFRTEAHRHVESIQEVGNTAVCSWKHRRATDATGVHKKSEIPPCARGNTGGLPTHLDVFDRELPVRRENIFSRREAACGQRVTTYKISSRRDGLKSEEKRGRRKPIALYSRSASRATQFSCQTSSVAAEAACGQRVTTTRRHLREPDTGIWPARDGGALKGLSPARVGVGGAARESVFRSSVRAVSRIEVPRPET